MFQKLLLPVDLSEKHGRALETAAELARVGGGEILLLHVIEIIAGLPIEEERAFYNRLEKMAHGHFRKLGESLERQRVSWKAEVRYGNRGAEILRCAQESRADLIILTAPAIDLQSPGSNWGSLSYKVGLLAPCAVLLVR